MIQYIHINKKGAIAVDKKTLDKKTYNLYKCHIRDDNPLYSLLDEWSHLANNLYNESLFVMRQLFTGLTKSPEKRHELESTTIEDVLKITRLYKKSIILNEEKRLVDYSFLDFYFKRTNNENYYSALPRQTAQAVIKEANAKFSEWLKALKDYKENPAKYTGKPRMPKYKKSGGSTTFSLTNQGAIFKEQKHNYLIKFPKTKTTLTFNKKLKDERLKSVNVKKEYGIFKITFLFEDLSPKTSIINSNVSCGIDLGVNNLAAIVTSNGDSLLVKGEFIKSKNQWFNKKIAKNLRGQTIGTEKKAVSSKALNKLYKRRQLFIEDAMHKVAKKIVLWCACNKVSKIIIGKNKGWKQEINIGKTNNQNFVQIPHALLISYIKTVAEKIGMQVVEADESYTSKASFLDMDKIPVYKKDANITYIFSGTRIKRGLYKDNLGRVINADLNGAGNIMRKVIPDKDIKVNIDNLVSPAKLQALEIYA